MMRHQELHHQSDADLIAYVHQQLTDAQRESIDQHLESCLECRRRLVDHANLQLKLGEDLHQQLAMVGPTTDWGRIAPRVHKPRTGRGSGSRLAGALNVSRRVLYVAAAVVYAGILLGGGFFLYNAIRDTVGEQQTVSLVDDRPTATAAPTPVAPVVIATSESPAMNTPTPSPEPTPTLAGPPVWDGQGRVNLLVMGIDQRGDQQGYWRTDSLLIVTIDPIAQTVGMISVPRDLWVPIWGYDIENRINTAHYYGDYNNYPGGGPALARDTVAYNLGIPIHHYVRLNFTAFERLIDEIGGIDVYVEKTINDPSYPDEGTGYDPFYLSAGQHHLDGKTALKYARSRHGTGDFDRANRQQHVLLAARDQVVKMEQLPRLIANGPDILSALGDSVRTDLSFDQAVQLAKILNGIPRENYRGAVIDQQYTQPYTTDTGAQVLIPLRDRIARLYESFFTSP
jgi:LCP family protein required for cell wall assembly